MCNKLLSVHNVDVTFIQLADAMELMLLSVLSPEVECEWGLSRSEEATITSVSKSTCNGAYPIS